MPRLAADAAGASLTRRRRSRPLDVAIIGMACRFPGATTLDAFWSNLVRGVESITVFSDDELRAAGVPPELLRDPHYVKAAPILADHAGFDAAFFGYSPREASLMDPQHRMFLEVAWEAFEDAGYDPLGAKGIVGVYAGAGGLVSSYVVHHDHPELRGQTGDLGHIANDRDFLPSRVSFKLDLRGPSINVQTACSTSLVAVHLACRSLRDGEADMALAGASVVRVPHIRGYLAEPGGIYSPDGHCRAFDARGSGTLFGSGVAAILLKPLARALADGDRVYAVIKGSAVDNDGGMKFNYTSSTVEAQARAMTEALAQAGVEAQSIGYVECHGTATALGDPLEIQALTRAFRLEPGRVGVCPIGSVKTNVGHLEQCAGLAGLVKASLALYHRAIPPSLHFETPNPRIGFDRSAFRVNTALRPFERDAMPRRAAVNSVGMGGTNAFVVLEEPPPVRRARTRRPCFLLTLSARTEAALAAQVANVRRTLVADDGPVVQDACLTLNRGRHHFGLRFSALGRDRAEIVGELDRFLGGDRSHVGGQDKLRRPPIVFLFSGQGSQYPRMGQALYRVEPSVRATFDRSFALFRAAGIDVADVLFGDDDGRLTRTLYAQPALFTLQVALTRLWRAWGIAPDTVVGHSVGEVAAAVAAGVCTLEDGVRLVATRAGLMDTLSGAGGMVAVGASVETVRSLWPDDAGDLAIAADNAPESVVVSGAEAALGAFVARCRRVDLATTPLKVSHAFHSPLMDPIADEVDSTARTLTFAAPRIRWISTLTGDVVTEAPPANYWSEQLRRMVRFRTAVAAAVSPGAVLLEIGPASTLVNLGRRCVAPDPGGELTWIPSLGAGDDWRSLLEAVRLLYLRGGAIQWEVFEPGRRRVSLPTYPFEHREYSLEPQAVPPVIARTGAGAGGDGAAGGHALLGERLGDDDRFESVLTLARQRFLADHRVFGRAVLPMTAVLETVIAAARTHLGVARPAISDFAYERALTIPDDRPVLMQVTLQPEPGRATFRLESIGMDADDSWSLHATGVVRDHASSGERAAPGMIAASRKAISPASFYRWLGARGLGYGPAFRGIVELWRDESEAVARVELPSGLATDGYVLHPAFLDACLHVYAAVVRRDGTFDHDDHEVDERAYVPIAVESFHVDRPGVTRGWVHAVVRERAAQAETRLKLDIRVWQDDGAPVAAWRGLTIVETMASRMFRPDAGADLTRLTYGLSWREVPRPARATVLPRHVCILADAGELGQRLAERLIAEGCTTRVVAPDVAVLDPLAGELPEESVGIVYLRALCAPRLGPPDPSPAPTTPAFVCGGCIDLVQALDRVRARFRTPPRIWLVTRGAQGTEAETLAHVAQATLWGLGRTLALESPDLWGGLIDLPADVDDVGSAALLVEELQRWGPDDQIVWRAGRRLVPRLTRLRPDDIPAEPAVLRPDATYWVVGGQGRLGLKVAGALVEAGARHVLLSGRRASEERTTEPLGALRRRAEVVVMSSDVTSPADVEAVLTHIHGSMPPLRGVVHAAAEFGAAVLANLGLDRLEAVLAPKVTGAWLLHHATRKLELDFFVLFSSVLSIWGGAGQSAYAAANSFLDALAAGRRAVGLPATVINWGPWAGASLPERWGDSGAALWKQRGTPPLSPEVGLAVFLRCLTGGPAQVVVSETRWTEFLAQFTEVPPLYRELIGEVESTAERPRPGPPSAPVTDIVREQATRVLGLQRPVDVEQPLNELGLDSLMAVTLANRLRQALGVAVPTAMLLKGSSVKALVAELFPEAAPPTAPRMSEVVEVRDGASRVDGRGWLIVHRPVPRAQTRLFCFPFAGGGAATFRPWTNRLDSSVELVAIEPPGRQTRIDEPPIRDIETFVRRLVPELTPFLDKPFAVYGHCLGALTLFETVRLLIRDQGVAPVHVFVSGARTPDELHRYQDFELNLLVRLCRLRDYDIFEPVYCQPDEVFAEALRAFEVLATETFLNDPELRALILPIVRADFEMSSRYRYTPGEPWDVPITCLTGTHDTYVTPENARAWSRFTKGRFQLITVEAEHFLVVDDDDVVIQVLNRELAMTASSRVLGRA